ncbi:hypothetical protein PYCC9005_005634 [Savitreella phatthalungensis]
MVAHSGMDMNMDMGSTSSTGDTSSSTSSSSSSMMMSLFHTSFRDPILWASWSPRSSGAYAVTWLAVMVLGILTRAVSAYMHVWERKVRVRNLEKGSVLVRRVDAASECDIDAVDAVFIRRDSTNYQPSISSEDTANASRHPGPSTTVTTPAADPAIHGEKTPLQVVLPARAIEPAAGGRIVNPWRLTVDVPRGLLHFLYAGLGYLLMLIVMTGNAGYFFAVLVGLFIGETAFGRYAKPPVLLATPRA